MPNRPARIHPVAIAPLAACALCLALAAEGGASQKSAVGGRDDRPPIDSAYAALDAGDLKRARSWADRALKLAPHDAEALIARGRVYLEWPRVGRFQALDLFKKAARQAPNDPEPHYWIGRTGLALLGDDGEAIARRGLERVLALDPLYRDAWELWGRLYRGPKDRARLVALLQPHADQIEIQTWIVRLWIESDDCALADSALTALQARWPEDPRWPAWRAECAFLVGRAADGWAHYERTLGLADRDTAGALWAQIASIARPDERAAFSAIPAWAREEFYRAFWSPRDPNLRTPENERIAEHFQRRAQTWERYPLLHPLSLYHYSMDYRNFVSRGSSAERESYVAQQLARGTHTAEVLSSSAALTAGERLALTLRQARPGADIGRLSGLAEGEPVPDLAGISPAVLPLGRNLPEMIDDRGLAFIRHGPPDRIDYLTLDVEEWAYDSDPPLRLRFARGWYPPDPPLPDMIYRPMTSYQAWSVGAAMTSDRTSLPAPLEFGFWFARFRALDDPHRTEAVIVPEATVAATAVLWDGAGRELARDNAPAGAPIRLTGPPGQLLLGIDVERSDSLGRYRGVIELPDFGWSSLAVSDVLIARGARGPLRDRDQAASVALPSLTLGSGDPFVIYLEIYELAAAEGAHRFELTYSFKQARGWLGRLVKGESTTALSFERVVPVSGDGRVPEALEVSAGRLPPGDYSLSVRVRDLVTGEERESGPVSIHLLR